MELDFLSGLLNLGIMAGIVGVVESIKSADKKAAQHKVLFIIIFFVICLFASAGMAMKAGNFLQHWSIGIGDTIEKFIIYFGLGTVFYKLIVKWLKSKIELAEIMLNEKKSGK